MNKYLVVKDGKEYTIQANEVNAYKDRVYFLVGDEEVAQFRNFDFWSKIVE